MKNRTTVQHSAVWTNQPVSNNNIISTRTKFPQDTPSINTVKHSYEIST